MGYDIQEIKESLSLEDIERYVTAAGGEPIRRGDTLVCRTICHCGDTHKLYWYDNTKLFRCYTDCDGNFDIFELALKIGKVQNENYSLNDAVREVAQFFGINFSERQEKKEYSGLADWKILKRYRKHAAAAIPEGTSSSGLLKEYDDTVIEHLPRPRIIPWIKEGIKEETIKKHNICYNPKSQGIIIPHYDIDNRLIGIRERTLIKENEKNGKYLPATINGKMYNHPLGLALYNLNYSKENITKMKKVICFESEKSCLKYASMVGAHRDISVACCGSNISKYQFELLKGLGIQELIIAFDKQYLNLKDEEHIRWAKKLTGFYNKYGAYVQVSFMFDKENVLGYKEAPIDRTPKEFWYLYKNRIYL